jgi:hypothetical protein
MVCSVDSIVTTVVFTVVCSVNSMVCSVDSIVTTVVFTVVCSVNSSVNSIVCIRSVDSSDYSSVYI